MVGDAVTAFAAGTPEPSGAVLIAGTGAVAALIDGHEIMRAADGLGWLLGDVGSGRWMGLQAVRAAVRDWSSPLASRVAAHAGAGSADELIRWAQTPPLPLASFAALAPVVCAAAGRRPGGHRDRPGCGRPPADHIRRGRPGAGRWYWPEAC